MSVPRWLHVLTGLSAALVLGPLAAWTQQKPACTPGTAINAPAGSLCGITADDVTAYLGIPFAQPPTGERRWKNPQPPSPWSGTFQATQMANGCPQPNSMGSCSPGQTEDCLYLNIWVPEGTKPSSKLPVMVYIYGGAFITGSDALPVYNGTSLAVSGNAIIVNLNYRLGALGFLVLDGITDATNNNFGFRDQIMALQWVQTNIASFGGNPANVTIFGESAGAMSVGLHALSSSQSSGLFNAAIMESNPLGIGYKNLQQADAVGTSFATGLTCMTDPESCEVCDIVTKELQVAMKLFSQGLGSLPWAPVVDGTLITQQPMAAAEAGALKVPMLLGTNLNEGNVFAALISSARTIEGIYPVIRPADYSQILQNVFGLTNAGKIQSQGGYACTQGLCGPTLARAINDYAFACANRHLAAQARSGMYTYQFTQPSGNLCNPWPGLFAGCAYLSCHGAEVPYVFDNPSGVGGGQCVFSPEEQALSSLMGSYWTSFARQQAPGGTPDWPSFKPSTTYMVLDTSPATAVDPWNGSASCSFWDQIGYPPQPAAATPAAAAKR